MAGEHTFTVEILTPEGELFRGDAVRLSTRTAVGEIGILANHVPVLAQLRPTCLKLALAGDEERRWAQGHGMLQMFGNHIQILLEEAEEPESLDRARLEEQRADAEARIASGDAGESGRKFAQRDLERIEAFLKLAA